MYNLDSSLPHCSVLVHSDEICNVQRCLPHVPQMTPVDLCNTLNGAVICGTCV